MFCREAAGLEGVVVAALTKQGPEHWRRQLLERIELADDIAHPDPETWGTSQAARAGQEQALRWAGGEADTADDAGGE
jgi:hypothetical protein